MKFIKYCIAILLAVTIISSCSKKEDNNNQQTEQSQQEYISKSNEIENIGEQYASEPNITEQKSIIQIIPVPSQDMLLLSPEQIIQILKSIDFTDSQIQEHAFSIREGLAKQGAVRIMIDNAAEAGLAVKGDEVFISTRSKGQFIYNINTGWLNPMWR